MARERPEGIIYENLRCDLQHKAQRAPILAFIERQTISICVRLIEMKRLGTGCEDCPKTPGDIPEEECNLLKIPNATCHNHLISNASQKSRNLAPARKESSLNVLQLTAIETVSQPKPPRHTRRRSPCQTLGYDVQQKIAKSHPLHIESDLRSRVGPQMTQKWRTSDLLGQG